MGVPKSCVIAAEHYRRAARAVATDSRNWPSALNFLEGKPPLPSDLMESPPNRLDERILDGKPIHGDATDADVIHYYRHLAGQNDAPSRTTLGALYYFGGHGIELDEHVARGHLEAAANLQHGQTDTILGHLDMRARSNESAMLHFMKGAANSDYLAHYALGMIYLHGLLGKEVDYSRAKMHFELTMDLAKTHDRAFFQLGMLYWYGRGVPRNSTLAFDFFRKAASAGNIQSKLNVGTLYVNNAAKKTSAHGQEEFCQKGVQYLKEVAEDGEWKSVLEMAMEKIDAKDWFGALHRYLQAAQVGIELAQYNAALLLERLSKNDLPEVRHCSRRRMLAESHELYELSALQGHTDSLVCVAKVVYVERKDYVHAADIFRQAADLGSAEGMVSLALMYAQGLGVQQNRFNAVRYRHGASMHGPDAFAPATLGLLAVRVYWLMEDIWRKIIVPLDLGSILQPIDEDVYVSDNITASVGNAYQWLSGAPALAVTGDVAIVGALLNGFLAVLIVRSKRLATIRRTEHSTTTSIKRKYSFYPFQAVHLNDMSLTICPLSHFLT